MGWETCSHQWIDPTAPPLQRQPLSPIIGPGRHEMKWGHSYVCANCRATLTPTRKVEPDAERPRLGAH